MTEENRLLNSNNEKNINVIDRSCISRCYLPTRYVIIIWGFFGFTLVYVLRVNLSVAIISMVNSSAINTNLAIRPECHFHIDNQTKEKDGPFIWDQKIQGIILGAFFWGYIPLQIPAGWIAVKIGGKWLFGFGVLWTSLLTLLTPAAARLHYGWLIGLRLLEGAGEVVPDRPRPVTEISLNNDALGKLVEKYPKLKIEKITMILESVTYPAMHSMLGYWAPALETTFMGSIVYSGTYSGLVVGLFFSALLIDANIMGGWPSVFYIPGIIGIVWFIIWSFVAYSRPAYHPRISAEEREYIESSVNLTEEEKSSSVPWKSIFLSLPVWAISVANFGSMWLLYTLLTSLPQYFKYILGFSMSTNGILNAFPHFLSGIAFVGVGILVDIIRSNNWLDTTTTRKLFNTLGILISAIFIVAIGFIDCNKSVIVTFLCIAMASGSTYSASYHVNHLDLAPQYGGVLYGLTNSIGTFSGIIGPFVVGILTDNKETREQWRIVFFITAGMTLSSALFYLIFASGDRQSWGLEKSKIEEARSDL